MDLHWISIRLHRISRDLHHVLAGSGRVDGEFPCEIAYCRARNPAWKKRNRMAGIASRSNFATELHQSATELHQFPRNYTRLEGSRAESGPEGSAGGRGGSPRHGRGSSVSRLRQALEILHGTADTLNFHSKAPQQIDGNHPPVGIERNHVGEHAAKGEGFRGFA